VGTAGADWVCSNISPWLRVHWSAAGPYVGCCGLLSEAERNHVELACAERPVPCSGSRSTWHSDSRICNDEAVTIAAPCWCYSPLSCEPLGRGFNHEIPRLCFRVHLLTWPNFNLCSHGTHIIIPLLKVNMAMACSDGTFALSRGSNPHLVQHSSHGSSYSLVPSQVIFQPLQIRRPAKTRGRPHRDCALRRRRHHPNGTGV
jgi:hypothetical protein